ncbi:MAG: BtrH N-terminal domain-containing protein [Anaerolineaceae bacterium]|nr:BtrH N-terminal domain-containing protein [Anaerolineaceae bacterium]
MKDLLTLPHRRAHGMCPVNGIRDLIQWRSGRDWSNQFVWGLGLGGGFAYLRFKAADPPRQVYWGIAGPRQHKYLAKLLNANYIEVENRTFAFSWRKAQQALDEGTPPVLGPLDMYHLHFYAGIYHQRHIPIHYVLLVGYDNEKAYVYDTGNEHVQEISLDELELAWDVNVPGLGKRNRLVAFDLPDEFAPTNLLIRQSISDQCQNMLKPPVSMVGIPAIRKVAREIAGWPDELGEDTANKCLRQVREYLNSPPDLTGDHLTAGRDLYTAFLEEAGEMAGMDFSRAVTHMKYSVELIPQLAEAISQMQLVNAAAIFSRIADHETQAYTELNRLVGTAGLGA